MTVGGMVLILAGAFVVMVALGALIGRWTDDAPMLGGLCGVIAFFLLATCYPLTLALIESWHTPL